MAQSDRFRLRDLREIHKLVGECRELGDSRLGWRSHMLDGLNRLVGCGFALQHESLCEPGGAGPVDILGGFARGWEEGFDRTGWDAIHAEVAKQGRSVQPACLPSFEVARQGRGPAPTRADLAPNDDWRRSLSYREYHSSFPGGATMYCRMPTPRPGHWSFFVLVRAAGEPDFSPRQQMIAQELHSQVCSLIYGPLVGYHEPSSDGLAPRARQVLRGLLEGEGDKRIAARLGLSRHTVNFYVRQIFDHFGVSTRSELMARWIRRGWGLPSGPRDAT